METPTQLSSTIPAAKKLLIVVIWSRSVMHIVRYIINGLPGYEEMSSFLFRRGLQA